MLIIVIAAGAAMVLYSSILILFSVTPKQRVKNRLNKLAENVELEYIHDAVLNEKKKQRKVKKSPALSAGALKTVWPWRASTSAPRNL